jgi:hypothetical protein
MNTQVETTRLILNHIFHPSDFSQASEVAFAHASSWRSSPGLNCV